MFWKNIHSEIKDNIIWISADETTDTCDRYKANLIFGALKQEPSSSYLIACKALKNKNPSMITRFVNEGIKKIFPESSADDRTLFFPFGGLQKT